MQHHRLCLPNGLRVVHVPMPAMGSVTVAVFVGLGSRYEPSEEAGSSHLIEHMLFKGTERRRSAAEISATLESVGGILNASTDKEATVYWAKVASKHIELAVDLLADMLRNSRLSPAEVAKEKRVILEELNMLYDDPQDWVHVLADELLWPGHPVGREVAGTRETVATIPRKTLRRYLDGYYGPNNSVVCVAGGVGRDEAASLISAKFGDWNPVPAPPPAETPETMPGRRTRIEQKAIEQVNICISYPGTARAHPDRWALDVLCTALGGSSSSRLFVHLRERLGLAYDVHAYANSLSDTGSITVYAGTEQGKSERVVDGILGQVDRLRQRSISAVELHKVKQYLRGRLWLGLEDSSAVASWFGGHELLHREVITPEQVADAVDAVTAADVRRAARTYLAPEDARLAAVGPVSNLERKLGRRFAHT
jgi:predicted Zn-dependent peptidase